MWGPPQAALSHQFADTGDGHGFLIESAQATTGLFAGAMPWRSGRDHKRRMKEWAYAAPLINLTREQGHGRVTIDEAGNAVTHYPMTDEVDIRNIRAGVETLIRVHEAAGATEIVGSGRKAGDWRRGEDLDAFIADVTSQPIAPREFVAFSAHQMGTCRMGSDPATSVADPRGELHDAPGVWIGDGCAFPSPSGTNPMATIMALARRTAHAISAGLTGPRRTLPGHESGFRMGRGELRRARRDHPLLPGAGRPRRRADPSGHGPRHPDDPLGRRVLRAAGGRRASA